MIGLIESDSIGLERSELSPLVWNNKHVLFNNIQLKRNRIKNLLIDVQDFEISDFSEKVSQSVILMATSGGRFTSY